MSAQKPGFDGFSFGRKNGTFRLQRCARPHSSARLLPLFAVNSFYVCRSRACFFRCRHTLCQDSFAPQWRDTGTLCFLRILHALAITGLTDAQETWARNLHWIEFCILYFVYQKLSDTPHTNQTAQLWSRVHLCKFLPHVSCTSFLSKLSCHAHSCTQNTAKFLVSPLLTKSNCASNLAYLINAKLLFVNGGDTSFLRV